MGHEAPFPGRNGKGILRTEALRRRERFGVDWRANFFDFV